MVGMANPDPLDFGHDGYYDDARTRKSGQAYYLAQVIGDIDRAFDGLTRDFRAGRFDPGAMVTSFKNLLRLERARPDEKPEYEQLQTAFADGGVDANMDALADALDTFETGYAQAFRTRARGTRIPLERLVEEFRSDLTQRGTASLTYAVDKLWSRVFSTLTLLRSDEVRQHASDERTADPAVMIATLGDTPVSGVRTRANRGIAVRKLSSNLVAIPLDRWDTYDDLQLIRDCEPLASWPREARLSRAEATDNGSVDDGEADRLRIQRRNASWATLS
jgi:hypothetical protein